MATRGTIAVQHQDGKVSQIYSHWDSYPEHNGRLLIGHYPTLELAEELVSLGDMSVLGERIHPVGEHSFDKSEDGTCVYYGRDRGEEDVNPRRFSDYEMYRLTHQIEEFNYIFIDGDWYLQLEKGKTLVKNILSDSE